MVCAVVPASESNTHSHAHRNGMCERKIEIHMLKRRNQEFYGAIFMIGDWPLASNQRIGVRIVIIIL